MHLNNSLNPINQDFYVRLKEKNEENNRGSEWGGGEGSACRLSVKISLLCRLSVKIFDLCRLAVNSS